MDVNTLPATATSRALPSLTPTNYGKRDLSLDGWRTENKCHKYVQEEFQADRQIDPRGINPNQAQDSSHNNENVFKVLDETTYKFGSSDFRYHPKWWEIHLQHENQDRNLQTGGVAGF